MTQLARILLVETATPPGSAAYRRAVELARRSGAALRICQFVFDSMIDFATGLAPAEVHRRPKLRFLEEHRRPLERARGVLQAQGLNVSTELIWSDAPHEALIAKAMEFGPDLVIANLALERDLLGTRTVTAQVWKFARLCPVPLMLVQEESATRPAQLTAAVDTARSTADEPLNRTIVDIGTQLCQALDGTLELLHVFPFVPLHDELQRTYESVRDTDRQRFEAFAREAGIAPERCHWRKGQLIGELRAYVAERHCELLIVGSVYRNAFTRLFLGSTAEAVVGGLSCDILVVKPRDFLQELGSHRDLDALCAQYGVARAALRSAA